MPSIQVPSQAKKPTKIGTKQINIAKIFELPLSLVK